MFKIKRKMEYALMALKHMSEKVPGELTSAKEISEAHQVPFDMISRVLQLMAQKGILKSEHGPHGGYQIQTDLGRVTFLELAEMILGPVQMVECLDKTEVCNISGTCNIISPIARLNERIKEFYQKISVRELVVPKQRGTQPMQAAAGGFVV